MFMQISGGLLVTAGEERVSILLG